MRDHPATAGWFLSGVLAVLEPHQSIPNLEVKQHGGDNTCGVTCWKDSPMPKKRVEHLSLPSVPAETQHLRCRRLLPRQRGEPVYGVWSGFEWDVLPVGGEKSAYIVVFSHQKSSCHEHEKDL